MTDQDIQLMPFGKYKGQPLEIVMSDKNYVEWLTNQEFIKEEKNINIYNFLVNGNNDLAFSKEHNEIVAMFYDKSFRDKFLIYSLGFNKFSDLCNEYINKTIYYDYRIKQRLNKTILHDCKKNDNKFFVENNPKSTFWSDVSTEFYGWDIRITDSRLYFYNDLYFLDTPCCERTNLYIEIKPLLGEDYPNVLRQIKRNINFVKKSISDCSNVFLILKEFNCSSTSIEILKEMFYPIKIFFVDEITKVELDGNYSETII